MRLFMCVLTLALAMPGLARAGEYGPSNWTGFYLGVHAGAANFKSSIRDDDSTVFDAEGLSYVTEDIAAVYGLQIGYNHHFGAAVIGLEADYTWTNYQEEHFFDGSDQFFSTHWNGFGTVRARFGLAHGNALVYATGGLAYFDVETVGFDNPDDQIVSFDGDIGFAAGAGAEILVRDNVTLKLEYMYLSAPEESDRCEGCEDDGQYANHDLHMFRIGVNYRLHRTEEYAPLK